MKRVKWLLLLCAFVLLWSSPGWAQYTALPTTDTNGVIDLQGQTYTIASNGSAFTLNDANKNITIKNGTITNAKEDLFDVSAGTLTLGENLTINSTNSVIYAYTSGKIIVNGAKINVTGGGNTAAFVKGANASLTVTSGELNGNNGNHVTLSVAEGAKAYINGGKVTSTGSTTIQARSNGSVIEINGGEVSTTANFVAGYAKGQGKIIVNGGTVSSSFWCALSAIIWDMTPAGTIEVNGGTINKAVGAYEHATARLKITGGTIGYDNNTSWAVYVHNGASGDITGGNIKGYAQTANNSSTLNISGGNFTQGLLARDIAKGCQQVKSSSDNLYYVRKKVTITAPTTKEITYGDAATLADIDLSDKKAQEDFASTDVTAEGTFAWEKPDTELTVANSGTYKLKFTPAKTLSFAPISIDVTVTVKKASITPTTPTGLTSTYGKTLADVTLPTADNGTWAWSDATTTSVGNAGTNTFKAQFTPTDTANYDTPAAVDVSITVAKAKATVDTAPTAKTLTYTGSAQALVEAGTATGGTLQYAVGTTAGTYSSEIPTGTDAGSYTVWYQVIGDNNHENFTAKSLTVTIAKAPASEITTQVGGTTTGTATTTNGKTNTKTSKTTTFTLGSGTGASTMSADVAVTTEEKLEAQAGSEFSTVVAVDTVLNGNKDFNQYAYSMDIVGLPSWITATGELTSSDTNAAGKTYHHEFTLKGTPAEAAEATSIAFTAWVTLSSDNYSSALKASADKSVEVAVAARPVPPVAPVLRIVDASEDKSLIITADVTNGSVTLDPDIIVEATAGTNFVWIVSGDLPKYLTATSTDKTLTISGYISDDLIAYSIVVIASNDVGSDSVKISFNVYKTETDESGAVTVKITSEDIEKIKETKGSDELTLSDVVDMTALNKTLASSGGALKLSNGITTLEGISALSNLTTLDLSEVTTLTTTSLTADNLGSITEIKIGENNTSITTVDLSGSKVETVTMQKSSVQTLTLGSSVKTVDAKDSANLTAIDFSQSTNVQTVNISGTQVASADLSNCTELVSFSFDVEPGNGTESAGALQTLKLPETSDKLENLAVRGNQLLWLSLGSSKYPNLKNVNVRGQRRGGVSIKMAFDFLEFLWNLYQQSLYENEADYEEYTEGAETPFDVAQISSNITYVASDDNSTQTATVTDGKVSFTRTPKNFKYEYDTGFRRSGRTASAGSFITAEDENEENGNMDVTIETGSVTGSAGGIASSSGGGCDAGFGYGALSALMLVFATLKKRR